MNPRVFVVQNQMRRNSAGLLVPKHDTTPALQFGQLVELLSPSTSPLNPESALCDLRRKLFSFSDADFLMCIGNPLLLSWAFAVAAVANNGNVAALQWSGVQGGYTPVRVRNLLQ